MRELTEWWGEFGGGERPWLVVGKGPSFDRRGRYDLRRYATLGINHVVRDMRVDVASAVNYDVVGDCADALYRNCRFLLMPRYPHSIPGEADALLETYFGTYPVLREMDREGRLVWYNLSSDATVAGSPVIENGPFSVCILFNLLGALGARRLRTLGVDGGLAYARSFRDMEARTRLANGMATYDYQFEGMMAAVERFGLDYAPLNPLPVRQRLDLLLHSPAERRPVRRWLRRVPWLPGLQLP